MWGFGLGDSGLGVWRLGFSDFSSMADPDPKPSWN